MDHTTGSGFPRRTKRAWTLLELLFVIAAVGFLAALLLIGINGTTRRIKRIQCAANLHQQSISLARFVSDHGVYPLWMNWGYHDGYLVEHGRYWRDPLDDFGRSTNRIWNCPGTARPDGYPKTNGFDHYGYNSAGIAVNDSEGRPKDNLEWIGLGGDSSATWVVDKPARPIPESSIAKPSEMIALGDGFLGWKAVIRDGVTSLGRSTQATDFFASTARSQKRHDASANIVFADGHIEPLKLDFLFGQTNDAALRQWNRDNQPHRERLGY